MSSKKAKAARKNLTVNPLLEEYQNFGVPLQGVKHLGKTIYAAFGLYQSEKIEAAYEQNTVEYNFESLEEVPVLFGSVEELNTLIKNNSDEEAKGLSLGIVLITDKTKLIIDEAGFIHLHSETFPFLVGDTRSWRNPKFGHIFDDEEAEAEAAHRKDIADTYKALFPMFDNVYKIEQIVDQAGMSNSLDRVVDKTLLAILSNR